MKDRIAAIKHKLDDAINQLCEVSWIFSERPGKDFTRSRKLPFRKIISFVVAMEGSSLTTEMLDHFGCSADVASTSAFVQQRRNLNAFAFLFDLFVAKTDSPKLYKNLRLIAADGSDIHISTNPDHLASYFPGTNGQSPYNLIHLDAMYDLLQHTYRFSPSTSPFDFLPKKFNQLEPIDFYKILFRIVRFKITDYSYETVVTNLDPVAFPPSELKNPYNMRWGIETSFRKLNDTIGLLHFHAKKWSTFTKKSLLASLCTTLLN